VAVLVAGTLVSALLALLPPAVAVAVAFAAATARPGCSERNTASANPIRSPLLLS
jgi:hypothetical protein